MSVEELLAIDKTDTLRGDRWVDSSGVSETYFTTDFYYRKEDAQNYLALPSTPDIGVVFRRDSGRVYGPETVQPKYGFDGGGTEYWSYGPLFVTPIVTFPLG
jgi:hypothetical protein